jgi:hypothetical protein
MSRNRVVRAVGIFYNTYNVVVQFCAEKSLC